MEHQRAVRLSWLITFLTAMALAIGIYVAGTLADTPGTPPQDTVQTQSSTVVTSESNDGETAIAPGAQRLQGDTTLEKPETHDRDRFEPEETGNDD